MRETCDSSKQNKKEKEITIISDFMQKDVPLNNKNVNSFSSSSFSAKFDFDTYYCATWESI